MIVWLIHKLNVENVSFVLVGDAEGDTESVSHGGESEAEGQGGDIHQVRDI